MDQLIHESLSHEVLGAAFTVHSTLGPGLLESVYEAAMCVELQYRGLAVEHQKPFPVTYRSEPVGYFFANVVVEGKIILELKAAKTLLPEMEAQLINYLKISGIRVGYLMNFHPRTLCWRRLINSANIKT